MGKEEVVKVVDKWLPLIYVWMLEKERIMEYMGYMCLDDIKPCREAKRYRRVFLR